MIEAFLLGAIATASFTAGVFFLKFWSATRDFLFLAFAVFFLVEGINRVALLLATRPMKAARGSTWFASWPSGSFWAQLSEKITAARATP